MAQAEQAIREKGYAHPEALVTTEWVAEHRLRARRGKTMRDNLKLLVGASGGALLVLLVFAAFTGGGTGSMGPGMGSGMMQGVSSMMGGVAGGLFTLLFRGLVVALIAALVAWIVRGSQR